MKSHKDIDRNENCPDCGEFAVRQFTPNANSIFKRSGLQESPEFNPGLGCVVKGKKHLKEICKVKGVEPIGNEKPETIHKHYDKMREEKVEKSYVDTDRGWVGSDGEG